MQGQRFSSIAGIRVGFMPDPAHSMDAASISSRREAPTPDPYAQSEPKRRRLRKGTHSCWECKRRKMKCIFDPLTDSTTACNGCRRRGSPCISQDFPEDVSFSGDNALTTPSPMTRADGVLQTRYANCARPLPDGRTPTSPANGQARKSDYGNPVPTPESMIAEPSRHLAFYTSSKVRMHGLSRGSSY